MSKIILHVGFDVHKESIDVALAPEGSTETRHYGTIGGDILAVDRMTRELLAEGNELQVAYEAGPCSFEIHRYFKKKGIDCIVVAPSRIPRKPADRVKTDWRKALDANMVKRYPARVYQHDPPSIKRDRASASTHERDCFSDGRFKTRREAYCPT